MRSETRLATAVLAVSVAVALGGCQTTGQKDGPDGGPKVDVSAMHGTWMGRGHMDKVRRTFEVWTDEHGNARFRYCYRSECRRSNGHTLTNQVVTPTAIEFRWNGGSLFTFTHKGDTIAGTAGNHNKFEMQRIAH